MKDSNIKFLLVVLVLLAWSLFMIGVGGRINESVMHDDAITQGYAEYNSTNGNWRWKKTLDITE